ncbi:MAG: sulfatase-like hydrolase/transferase, partial [Planctomycetes bacterium]|nr:sulfatase-like hydrolase/transferase [Planctomycetota bacterium]
ADYDHSQIGKWHLATRKVGGLANPLQHGFNYTAGPRGTVPSYFKWPKQVNGELIHQTGYVTSDTTDDAIARANTMRAPWFLWLAYNAAHEPFHVPPAHLHHQPNPKNDPALLYAAMVEALDSEIGRLLESIKPDILSQTTVIFLGDNGTPRQTLRPPYSRYQTKGSMTEGGINVPLIVAGPPVPSESQGLVCDALVNTTDLYATVADIARVDLSAALPAGHILDSHSIVPLLERPRQGRSIRRFAYSERFKPNGPPPYDVHLQAIRDRRWKLVRVHQPYSKRSHLDHLYDLSATEDGLDGRDLCPCPRRLEGEALEAYRRLVKEIEAIEGK